jgi:putative membrane protein
MVAMIAHATGAWGWLWPLWFVLFWVGIFFVFGFFGRRRARAWHQWHGGRSGEEVLGERYARGEIDESEYRKRLEVLRGSR